MTTSTPRPPAYSKPDTSELWSLSEALRIDLPREKHLLTVVRMIMKSEVPSGWAMHTTTNTNNEELTYYYNSSTAQSLWFRPITRENLEQVRVARQQTSKVAAAPQHPTSTSSSTAMQPHPPSSHHPQPNIHSTSSLSQNRPVLYASRTLPSTPQSTSNRTTPTSVLVFPRQLLKMDREKLMHNGAQTARNSGTQFDFSHQAQQALLSRFATSPHILSCIVRLQRFFRKWRQRNLRNIKKKLHEGRKTMDSMMMKKLAEGRKSKTTSGRTSPFLSPQQTSSSTSAQQQMQRNTVIPGLNHIAAPAISPIRPALSSSSSSANSPPFASPRKMHQVAFSSTIHAIEIRALPSSPNDPINNGGRAAFEKAAKRRASLKRMEAIQKMFAEEGGGEHPGLNGNSNAAFLPALAMSSSVASLPTIMPMSTASSSSIQSTPTSPSYPHTSSTKQQTFSPVPPPGPSPPPFSPTSPLSPASEDSRRGMRLNHRRRTLNEEEKSSMMGADGSNTTENGKGSIATGGMASRRQLVPIAIPASVVASSSSSSSSSSIVNTPSSNAVSVSSPAPTARSLITSTSSTTSTPLHIRPWQFLRIVLLIQHEFKRRHLSLNRRRTQKISEMKSQQTREIDLILRRVSLPLTDRAAMRTRRLTMGQTSATTSRQNHDEEEEHERSHGAIDFDIMTKMNPVAAEAR